MLTAEIRFAATCDEDREAITGLVGAWYKNGQVLDWYTAQTPENVRILALLPKADAVASSNNNVYAARCLADLADRGLAPEVEILGSDPGSASPCCCERRPSLVLFTHFLSVESPVRCGDCFGPVPLYELPHTKDQVHLNILHWAADYRACDTLQMHCTTGERFGEAQLGRHDSSLSRDGMNIAARLSAMLDIPVYYYLLKMRGVSASQERRRLCPSCGGQWSLCSVWHELFDFKCDLCRLLSNTPRSLSR